MWVRNFSVIFFGFQQRKTRLIDTYEIRKTEKELAKALFRPSKPEIDHPGCHNSVKFA